SAPARCSASTSSFGLLSTRARSGNRCGLIMVKSISESRNSNRSGGQLRRRATLAEKRATGQLMRALDYGHLMRGGWIVLIRGGQIVLMRLATDAIHRGAEALG